MNTDQLARTLILVGVAIVAVGVALLFVRQLPFLGRLPGDIRIERPGFRLYAPLTTSVLLSVILSLLLYLFTRKRQ